MSNSMLYLGAKPEEAKVICVFVHGRGQSPEMMQEHVIRRLSVPGVAYILPRADNGTWYAARATAALTEPTRSELAAALDHVRLAMGEKNQPILLGGFSQGACLVIEYAMKFGPWNGALASFTGCRVGVEGKDRPIENLGGMPVYLSGADADPWIPVVAFAQAVGDLTKARARLRVDSFPGREHEVGDTEIGILSAMLRALIDGKPVL
jgi:phospholipase/carboxylesterase